MTDVPCFASLISSVPPLIIIYSEPLCNSEFLSLVSNGFIRTEWFLVVPCSTNLLWLIQHFPRLQALFKPLSSTAIEDLLPLLRFQFLWHQLPWKILFASDKIKSSLICFSHFLLWQFSEMRWLPVIKGTVRETHISSFKSIQENLWGLYRATSPGWRVDYGTPFF